VRRVWKGFSMSKYIARGASSRNKSIDVPDLLYWRSATLHRPSTRAAQYVMRRYRVPPHTAEVIAALAGLGADRETAR
jgi:hypothetical protein